MKIVAQVLNLVLMTGLANQSFAKVSTQNYYEDNRSRCSRDERDCEYDQRNQECDNYDQRDRDYRGGRGHWGDRGDRGGRGGGHTRPQPYINGESLFNVSGVQLGYVTVDELRRMGGQKKDSEYNYLYYSGFNFWYHSTQTIYNMYITLSSPLPREWMDAGLNRDLSYQEASSLLQSLGFTVVVKKQPTQEYYEPGKYYAFSANLVGTIVDRNNKKLAIELAFNFSKGTTSTSGTLYSIDVKVQ